MPFTPSHIAAVLPLLSSARARRVLDPWALALGTMAPDLPIFLPFLPDYAFWHSTRGVLTIDPLAVVVLLALFHGLLRDPLTALLPPGLSGRVAALFPGEYGLRQLPAVIAGGVVGAFTHKLWDSFTHHYSSAFWGWDWLDARVAGLLPVFRLLQYLSTVGGLAAVAWWALRGLTRMPPQAPPERLLLSGRTRYGVLLAAVLATLLGGALWPLAFPPHGLAETVTRVGAGVVAGCGALLLLYAGMWQLRRLMAVFEGV
ncbi:MULTISPECIES: DUF4184 family protein [Streptosporangium]|uniref:DUF4184 domain-containing protein n=1 Tax=Streptosporangium brasiliense TaxID=47480 RepID=A0ABT9R9D9_9ACTN|nr:DUF4184 family protein [Streptosporangium brasiliense]MDP9865859.1 hypothetical protein [Streptosporangium brasiliense]